MATNFDFLKADPQFESFADAAVQAEQVYPISGDLCVSGCRRAMEFAVKWMYSVDKSLKKPYDDRIVTLISTEDFKGLIPDGMFRKVDYLRRVGNNAVHNSSGVTKDQAALALENLHSFLDFVAYCYATDYVETAFDKALLSAQAPAVAPVSPPAEPEIDFQTLLDENFPKREKLTSKRVAQLKHGYTVKPMDFSEAQTRKAYIDVMLEDAGWQQGKNWINEYRIDAMPNKSGIGYADYVLFGDNGKALAVIEAKKTSVSVEAGRQQAKLYADFLESKFSQRPIIFLTNGYETRIWDDAHYPERQVSGIYSKRDLEKEFNKMKDRKPLEGVQIKEEIAGRYYQKEAVQSVCDAFGRRNRRKALLVMATGSGKTRTIISLVDVLSRHGWVKNVLFLADRTALVTQAKRAFHNLMPHLSLCNLGENKADAHARVVFSTYPTMSNCIDASRDEQGRKLFTPGHFDLIIVDEAHRSVYNKYKDIFTYFDALLVGLTATPKADVDKDTYQIFDLEKGVPTYGYDLAEAVKDGHLVDFLSIETKLKFMTEGIRYDQLPPEERAEYENTFSDENGSLPEKIESSALNEWLFNHDTIKKALHILMENGQRVDYGQKIGKTIIFAKNHPHAEKILEIWNQEYSEYPSRYCQVIDNYSNYAQSLIDDFSDPEKLPQIAISVDMLDTGIDVPEILNLVFFKKVMSKAKFWQMIGRGTRTCGGLIDGEDKSKFYIFDLCGNFAFFSLNAKGKEATAVRSLQERICQVQTDMIYQLQDAALQSEELQAHRSELVKGLAEQIAALPRDNFAVKQHLRFIDKFSEAESFAALSYENTLQVAEHIAPLMPPGQDDSAALRFDMLIYQIELAIFANKNYKRAAGDLRQKAQALSKLASIPAVQQKSELIRQIESGHALEQAGALDFERIRMELRDLIKFIPNDERTKYNTHFTDDILSVEWNESNLDNDDLDNYKKKVNYYILEHLGHPAIAKLRENVPLTPGDVEALERILWQELGTPEQYTEQFGKTPLGELVRSIVGLSQQAANDAFSHFLNDAGLDSRQMRFVKYVVDYIVKNGMLKDLSVLQQSPFSDMGSVSEVFEDLSIFMELRKAIEAVNLNAAA